MKYEIMLKILFELLSHKSITARYIAEKYSISTRTVYRYVEQIEGAGVPIYTDKGKGGGIKIMDTYKLPSSFMTISEFETAINTLLAVNESVYDKTLDVVINKLKGLIKNEYSSLDIKCGNLIIDASPWGDTKGYKSKLKVIQTAMDNSKQLFIKYRDRNGESSERIIEPHIIVFKQGIWYVYAYCTLRNEFRFFKTGRIENAELLKTTFYRQNLSRKDLPLDFWENNVKAQMVEMEIDKSCVSDVEEWLGIENIEKVKEKFYASAILPIEQGLVSKIMSYGANIKVLSPLSLKNEIKEKAQKICEFYK